MRTLMKSGFTGEEYDYEEWKEWNDGDWAAMFMLTPRGMRCEHSAELPGFIRADAVCLNDGWHLFNCKADPGLISPKEAQRFLCHAAMERSGGGYLLPSHGSREPLAPEIVELLQRLAPDLNIQSGDGTYELAKKVSSVRGRSMALSFAGKRLARKAAETAGCLT
jgi:hypothetical protein